MIKKTYIINFVIISLLFNFITMSNITYADTDTTLNETEFYYELLLEKANNFDLLVDELTEKNVLVEKSNIENQILQYSEKGSNIYLSKSSELISELDGIAFLKFHFSLKEYNKLIIRYDEYKNKELYNIIKKNMEYILVEKYLNDVYKKNSLYPYFKLKKLVKENYIKNKMLINEIDSFVLIKAIHLDYNKLKKLRFENMKLVFYNN